MSHKLRRLMAGVCLIAAPVVYVAGLLVDPALRAGDAATGAYGRHPDQVAVSAALLHWSRVLLVPGIVVMLGDYFYARLEREFGAENRGRLGDEALRSRSPSFWKIRLTWVRTVASPTPSRSPISGLESPRANCASTSCSRAVRVASSDGGSAAGRAANEAMTRVVMAGSISASPAAATRTAATSCSGGDTLRRNPLTPSRSAACRCSSVSNVVSMMIFGGRGSASNRRAADTPSNRGIAMSMTTTSGRNRRAAATASSPSAASPTTVIAGAAAVSTTSRSPARIIA